MKIQREVLLFLSWILLAGELCYCDEEKTTTPPPKHENIPRLFRIFSRPGDKSTEKQEGSSFMDHLGNVFSGGSIGFEVEGRPLAPVHDLIDKAKEFIPKPFLPDLSSSPIEKAKDLFPIPFLPGLRPPNKDTERKDSDVKTETKPKPEDQWEPVVEPEKPKNTGDEEHKSESIDESDEEYDYVTKEPIENIIQPRNRQKRSPESRVFHVPLQFLSNAKPFEVKIK